MIDASFRTKGTMPGTTMPGNATSFAFLDVCERDMDFLFAEEIECNQAFREWLVGRTGGRSEGVALVRVGRSIATNHGETDLLVVHSNRDGGTRALMIENKIAAAFTRLQAERYRIRGMQGVRDGEWSEFATVLVAPKKRLAGVAGLAFDYQVSYEECEAVIAGAGHRADFKRRALHAACNKATVPGVPKVDPETSAWFAEARRFAVAEFPDLPLPAEVGRAFNNTWLTFFLKEFPQSRVCVEIKPQNGVVDLRLYGVPLGDLRREFVASMPPEADTDQAKTGKSSAIRIRHSGADVRRPFQGQEATLRPMLQSADMFMRSAKQHHAGIMVMLGFDNDTTSKNSGR